MFYFPAVGCLVMLMICMKGMDVSRLLTTLTALTRRKHKEMFHHGNEKTWTELWKLKHLIVFCMYTYTFNCGLSQNKVSAQKLLFLFC